MREITFRAWDKDEKRFTDETADWETLITLDGRMSPYPPKQNIVLLQYTGLKDKNGKEIYEGDIVKSSVMWRDYPILTVEWRPELCRFVLLRLGGKDGFQGLEVSRDSTGLPIDPPQNKSFEVIGNIYENRELLE